MKRAEVRLQGIVARAIDYKENDKMVTIITKNGSPNLIVKGVKSEKAKLKLAVSLFCYADYCCLDGEVKQVKTATVLDPHASLCLDLKKYSAASIIVEIAEKLCKVGGETEAEFWVVKNALTAIEEGEASPLLIAVISLKRLLDIEGVDLSDYAIPTRVKSILSYVQNTHGDYDSIDCTEGDVLATLSTLSKIFSHAFSIYSKSINETIKALSC